VGEVNILPLEDAFKAVLCKYKGIAMEGLGKTGPSPPFKGAVVPDSPYRFHFRGRKDYWFEVTSQCTSHTCSRLA
jgi:hypothetical protein